VKLVKAWTCPSCNCRIYTPYCPACGESPAEARELTLRGLFEQLIRAFSTIDGRLMRSLRSLLSRPGALTVAYVQGQRIPYVGPLQLFLVANVLFFAMQSLTNTNIVSTTLDSHLHNQDWRDLAQRLVSEHLDAKQTTLEVYTPIFNRAVILNAKSLIILMVLPFAVLLPIVFYRNRQPIFAHVVFSLYFYAFLLLLFCVSLAIVEANLLFGGSGLISARMDNILTAINLTACATYLYVATGTVYGASGAVRIGKVIALALAVAAILLGYRFALLLITWHTT
jgi:hypothetical protein